MVKERKNKDLIILFIFDYLLFFNFQYTIYFIVNIYTYIWKVIYITIHYYIMKKEYLAIITIIIIAMFIMVSFSGDIYKNDLKNINERPASNNYTKNKKYNIHA